MKKLFILFALALAGLCASAQGKGDMALGLNLGVAPCLESGVSLTNFGLGAKFQYNVSNPVRLEADLDYWFKDRGFDVFDVSANVQYIFKAGKLNVYPTIGIGLARVGYSFSFSDYSYAPQRSSRYGYDWDDDYDDDYGDEDFSSSSLYFFFNVGLGLEYAVSNNVAIGAELKYQYIDNFSRLPITVGATYRF